LSIEPDCFGESNIEAVQALKNMGHLETCCMSKSAGGKRGPKRVGDASAVLNQEWTGEGKRGGNKLVLVSREETGRTELCDLVVVGKYENRGGNEYGRRRSSPTI